jgi:hypothetical protein
MTTTCGWIARWRMASLLVAALSTLAIPLVFLVVRDRPAEIGLAPFGVPNTEVPPESTDRGSGWQAAGRAVTTVVAASRTRTFWLLAGTFFICGWTTNGIVSTHFVPTMHDHGMGATTAASLQAVVGIEQMKTVSADVGGSYLGTAAWYELEAKGVEMADCTISGTSAMAKVKDTVFMFGGKKEIYDAVLPLFEAMGREWVYMGAHGNGATIKLVVNLVLALNRMALAEGLTLAKKAGLDAAQTLEVLKKSAAGSKCMDQKGKYMVEENYLPPKPIN